MWETRAKRIKVQGQAGTETEDPTWNKQAKKVCGVAKVVMHLPSKCVALSLNPNVLPPKKVKDSNSVFKELYTMTATEFTPDMQGWFNLKNQSANNEKSHAQMVLHTCNRSAAGRGGKITSLRSVLDYKARSCLRGKRCWRLLDNRSK
jgi:hypothetical protein